MGVQPIMLFRRPLLPCVLAYMAGLWLVHDVFHQWPAAAMAMFAALCAIACGVAIWQRVSTPMYLLALLVLGAAVMSVRERQTYAAADLVAQLQGPGARVISGTVTNLSELADTEKSRVILKNVTVTSGVQTIHIPGKVQLTLDRGAVAGGNDAPVPGVRLTFPGRIYQPAALHNFFGYDRIEALRHEAIYASAAPLDLKGIVRVRQGSAGLAGVIGEKLVRFRQNVTSTLHQTMWKREGRLMVAMLFNDMRSLTEDEKQIFRESGTFHLFAVSGMHVAILALVLNLLFRALRFGIRASWISTAIVLFFYLWIINFVPSATRSYLMLTAFTAGYMLRREVDPLTSLIFAITAAVACDPAAPWKAGFVLSVVGVGSIVLFTPLLRIWFPWPGERHDLNFWGRRAADAMDLLMATLAIAIVMLPLHVYYFGFWNALSPVANLLQAALAGLVLSAGVFTAAAGMAGTGIGELAGQSASALMRGVYWISRWAAEADWAIFYARQVPAWIMLGCYAAIIGGYYLVYRDAPEFRFKSRARFATHTCCGLGLLVMFQLYNDWRRPGLELWALDVGQGDSTLIRFPNGETALIDGGKSQPDMGRLVVVQQLRGLGINRLDYIIATHDDDDHTGGLTSVIRAIGCRHLLIPARMNAKSYATKRMLQAAREQNCIVQKVSSGYTARAGEALVEILNPAATTASEAFAATLSDNEESVVVRVSFGNFVTLLMGDAGIPAEGQLINERLLTPTTVLKAGHHGSRSSTGAELLAATRPAVAFISCGAGNRFGHPAKDVLHRLARAGTRVLRTDTDGAICIQTDGYNFNVRTRRR